MRVSQFVWTAASGWVPALPVAAPGAAPVQLLLVFGSGALLRRADLTEALGAAFPGSARVGCSTAGEVSDVLVRDDSLVATAIHFERCTVEVAAVDPADAADEAAAVAGIARTLVRPCLRHVLALCDGLKVNGSAFAHALQAALPSEVCATGGLAADGDRFAETLVWCAGAARPALAVAVGIYGEALRVGYGSLGGWDRFGPARRITKSRGNVLFELDGQSALELYKTYLGDHARGLPGSALLFPLVLDDPGQPDQAGLVRTVLGVDEAAGSLTFAGDMPQGAHARLMKANVDRLVDGASEAAGASGRRLDGMSAELALLVSCVGRRLVMRQRTEEELEAVRHVLPRAVLAGFYSYGELCPQGTLANCELHNQTMTITTLAEA